MISALARVVYSLFIAGLFSVSTAQATQLSVVHAIDGRELGQAQELPVDVSVNGTCVFRAVRFTEAVTIDLGIGTYIVRVFGSSNGGCSGAAIIERSVVVSPEDQYSAVSLVASLGANGSAQLALFQDRGRFAVSGPGIVVRHVARAGGIHARLELRRPQTPGRFTILPFGILNYGEQFAYSVSAAQATNRVALRNFKLRLNAGRVFGQSASRQVLQLNGQITAAQRVVYVAGSASVGYSAFSPTFSAATPLSAVLAETPTCGPTSGVGGSGVTTTPTTAPTATFTVAPIATCTAAPTATFTVAPTATFTVAPTATFTAAPTAVCTLPPTATPTATRTPTAVVTAASGCSLPSSPCVTPTPTPQPVCTTPAPPIGEIYLCDRIAEGRRANGDALPGYLCRGRDACVPCTVVCGHPSSVVNAHAIGATWFAQYNAARSRFPGRMPEWPGAGTNYMPGDTTLDKACNLAGYREHISSDITAWHSPGDNFLIRWDIAQKRFIKVNGAAGGGRWAGNIRCRGVLHASCRGPSNLGWVFR